MQQKTWRLRKASGNHALKSTFDKGESPFKLIKTAAIRPSKMIIRSPILVILSLESAIVFAYQYVLFTTFTTVFENQYDFNTGEAGLAYLGLGIGFCTGQMVLTAFSDPYIRRQKDKRGAFNQKIVSHHLLLAVS